MISQKSLTSSFAALGEHIQSYLSHPEDDDFATLKSTVSNAFHKNGWFTQDEVEFALNYWAEELKEENLKLWLSAYNFDQIKSKEVGLILAGNIPMVGFHDVLSTILCGHKAILKCSSSDELLIPYFLDLMSNRTVGFSEHYRIEKGLLKNFDAVIATGSNNSARHFEHYFKEIPSIIRKNRTAISVLTGEESDDELYGLMKDAFQYYGLGCRNVTKIYLPRSFDLDRIFKASMPFAYLSSNKKYFNNVTYHKTLLMMQQKPVLENDLILLVEESSLFSPVGMLHYEFYDDINELNQQIERQLDDIQCVVGRKNIPFGTAQKPSLADYADGVDTMKFLVTL
ncbi:acyl-CoA reductase [Salibacteraceae bacterium]|jgi:hypothetical protein|nr:acyl-CoA reductase [Salibacteraceae bacterium]MDB9708806.1 acyl-CoA reductase [Salibacteraceae bacterium]MDC1304951.1 acyl-CoA reductase [Salibacteraceae bacterium]HAQ69532.1 acyl-CoA reductase [Flavobacteriales bacterium]